MSKTLSYDEIIEYFKKNDTAETRKLASNILTGRFYNRKPQRKKKEPKNEPKTEEVKVATAVKVEEKPTESSKTQEKPRKRRRTSNVSKKDKIIIVK